MKKRRMDVTREQPCSRANAAKVFERAPTSTRSADTNRYRRWTAGEIALLGTMPDALLSRKLRRSIPSIQLQRKTWGIPGPLRPIRYWTCEDDALLGTATDHEVADKLGRSVLAVQIRRRELGIPGRRADGQRPWEPYELDVLRLFPDSRAAKMLHRTIGAVITKRSKLGIPSTAGFRS